MAHSGQEQQEEVKEEVKESEKIKKRRGSFDLETNKEYADRQQQKTLELTAQMMGLTGAEKEEFLKSM